MTKQAEKLTQSKMAEFSDYLSENMGLYFPKEGWKEFAKKLAPVVTAFGFEDPGSCVEWLMKAPLSKDQITTLALYLTVGETYFFRDPPSFKVLENKIFPDLISKREGKDQSIRIWCAACCSGEEPYSLAILLSQMIPNLQDWNINILGTDINLKFLQKAESGIYKDWSFRQTPNWIKEKYFNKRKDGKYQLIPEIRKMVKFSYLNLVEDTYPSVLNGTNAMDLILCNNVLIYFSHKQIYKVIRQLSGSLIESGWLLVSPIEAPFIKDTRMMPLNVCEKLVFKKVRSHVTKEEAEELEPEVRTEYPFFAINTVTEQRSPAPQQTHVKIELPAFLNLQQSILDINFSEVANQQIPIAKIEEKIPEPQPEQEKEIKSNHGSYDELIHFFQTWQYEKVITALEKKFSNKKLTNAFFEKHSQEIMLLVRAYANQGKLVEAAEWCSRILSTEKLDPHWYYLYATILQEQHKNDEAITALKSALYLDQNFVIAHFALGNLMLANGKEKEAKKYFRNTLELLKKVNPAELLPGAEEMTAGRLNEILLSMKGLKV